MTRRLAGRRVLVTGAGKGIGRETVRRLVADSVEVVALSRTAADLDTLRAETGYAVIAIDLADLEAAAGAVALPLDGLVNNAASTSPRVGAGHVDGAVRGGAGDQHAGAAAVGTGGGGRPSPARQEGAIVNLSSVASAMGLANHVAYCAFKAALDALTRVLAVELGPHGIRTNSVNTAVTLTPMGSSPGRARRRRR